MKTLRKTTCNRDCPDACSIVATVEDGRITRLAGDPDHPVTRGFLCFRTSHFLPLQYSPDRLVTPLLARNGGFEPIGWEQALDFAAERLTAIRRESGPAAIFHYRSGGSLGLTKHLVDWFFELFGPVTAKRGDICSGAGEAAQERDLGVSDSSDLFDLLHSRHVLLWGKNPFVSSPHTLPVLKDAAAGGTRLVLVDPVHHRTAKLCERHWQPRPGADFALAMAVARVLFERGWTDPLAGEWCLDLDGFRALACSRAVEDWCREADVPPEAAADLARRLGPERPAAILVGWGMARRVGGGGIVRALDALSAVTGNLGVPGGGVSYYFKRRAAFDTSFVRGQRAAPRTVCEPLFGEEVLRAADPPIRAVWITAGNPVAMLPDSRAVARALSTRELVVVADSFLTDTARLAHLVLPTTTLLEADDLVGAYGHHWVGNASPLVAPPEGARSDLEIVQELARRVGLGERLAGSARDWKRRMLRPGLDLEALEQGAVKSPFAPGVLFAGRRFPTHSGKVELIHELPPMTPRPPPDHPLLLLASSTDRAQSSLWSERCSGPAEVTVHPDAAAGVADGEVARLESALGSLEVRVRHDARQRRDVALMAKGGHLAGGRCANALVRARLTDLGEGGALYDEPVRLVPAGRRATGVDIR